ncbi:MAG: hypothetical protein E7214_14125 [Clostridium sp.]|nr:hypothetical protein [Clostridium sp.]
MKAENFKICYRKLKSYAYFDKAEGILRKQIVQFELRDDFEKRIKNLYNILSSKQDKKWNDFLSEQLEEIHIYKFPKSIDTNEKEEIIINMEHDGDIIKVTKDNIQYRIGMPIELHILSIIWIEMIGKKIDKKFADTSYGNRLLIQEDINESDEDISEKWSPYLYKPYFNEYESWRDKGLEVAEKCYREKEDCLIIMLDIKRFFYSVSLKQEMFDNFIDGASKENARLNELVFKVCEKYSEIIHRIINDKNENIFLPIVFLPSAILANWYLDEFDKNIIDRVNPDYYGRYVDDMIIVHKIKGNSELKSLLSKEYVSKEEILNNYFIDFKQQNLIKNSLITPNKDDNVRSGEKTYQINFFDELSKESKLEINDNKIKIFYLKAGGTKALIDKFKESIKNNSSEFRLLPDGNNIFLDNYNDIYKLKQNESINSLRGIEDIKIDKYELSKFIGKNLTVANLIKDASESKFYDDLEKIFQPSIIIENYLLWESILNLCIVNKRLDKFKSFTDNIINAISMINKDEEVNNKSIDIKNTLINYLF